MEPFDPVAKPGVDLSMKEKPTENPNPLPHAEIVRRVLRGRELVAKGRNKKGHSRGAYGKIKPDEVRADRVYCDNCYGARPMAEINKACQATRVSCGEGTMRPVAFFADDLQPKATRDGQRLIEVSIKHAQETSLGVSPTPSGRVYGHHRVVEVGILGPRLNAPGHDCVWCPKCEAVRDKAEEAAAVAALLALRKLNKWTSQLLDEDGLLDPVYCSACGAGTNESGRIGQDCSAGMPKVCEGSYQKRIDFAPSESREPLDTPPRPGRYKGRAGGEVGGSRILVAFDQPGIGKTCFVPTLPPGCEEVNKIRRANGYNADYDAPVRDQYCSKCARSSVRPAARKGHRCKTKACRGRVQLVADFVPKPSKVPMVLHMELRPCSACGNWNHAPELPEVLHASLTAGGFTAHLERECDACATTIVTKITPKVDGERKV